MNVILLTPDFPPYSPQNKNMGGIATFLLDLAKGLTSNGHTCTVLCYQKDKEAEPTFDGGLPFKTVRLTKFWRRHFRSPLLFFKLLSCIQKNSENVFIAGSGNLSHTPVFFSRFFTFKTATLIHGNDVLHTKNNRKIIQSLKKIDLIITNSLYTKQVLYGIIGKRDNVITINPFFSPERFPEIDDIFLGETRTKYSLHAKKVILTTGRLIERKNHCLVIKAMKRILEKFPEATYLIIGQGPYKERLEKQVRALNLEDHVQFLGFVSQKTLRALYEIAEIFIMPSKETDTDMEGFGIVLLEAMALKKPIVASRVGGIPEVVEDGVTGLLVPPGDPKSLARALLRLLRDPPTRFRMGQAGRQRLETYFTLEQTMAKLQGLYRSLVSPSPGIPNLD